MASYEVEWRAGEYLAPQHLVIRVARDRPVEHFLYPEDPYLPGLADVARPETALRLVNREVLFIPARSARVELIRYRPTWRAVLRHKVDKARLYARVLRSGAVSTLLAAHELVREADFVVPRLAGCWADGGVVWLTEVSGENLRLRLRRGEFPNPDRVLDGLESLWRVPSGTGGGRPFNLRRACRRALRSFRHNLRDESVGLRELDEATRVLDPFIQSWRPAGMAHNDFYDDQMLVMPDGRIALVDFEEAGPGDPMLDVGNFLAHLRWSARFREREAAACRAYGGMLRRAALKRFLWDERDLALREAACLLRVCTNTIRHPQPDWHDQLEAGLALVNETLGQRARSNSESEAISASPASVAGNFP